MTAREPIPYSIEFVAVSIPDVTTEASGNDLSSAGVPVVSLRLSLSALIELPRPHAGHPVLAKFTELEESQLGLHF